MLLVAGVFIVVNFLVDLHLRVARPAHPVPVAAAWRSVRPLERRTPTPPPPPRPARLVGRVAEFVAAAAARRGRGGGHRRSCASWSRSSPRARAPTTRWRSTTARCWRRPSAAHWLGTDAFGRDVLSRLIYGSRTALLVGFGAALLGATLGAVLGVASAYFGGRVDLYLQRVMDVFLCVPADHPGPGRGGDPGQRASTNLILAITIPMIPRCALVIRLERARHPRDALRRRGARGRLRPRRGSSCATCCPT